MTPLYKKLHEWSSKPFVWGETDCIMFIGDWIEDVHGNNPFEEKKYTYDSKSSCQRETGFFSDPVGTIDKYLLPTYEKVSTPSKGDVALIDVGEGSPVGAIWLGTCWGCKGPNGTSTLKDNLVKVVAIWGVDYEE